MIRKLAGPLALCVIALGLSNVQAATQRDREVGEIPADAVRSAPRSGCTSCPVGSFLVAGAFRHLRQIRIAVLVQTERIGGGMRLEVLSTTP